MQQNGAGPLKNNTTFPEEYPRVGSNAERTGPFEGMGEAPSAAL